LALPLLYLDKVWDLVIAHGPFGASPIGKVRVPKGSRRPGDKLLVPPADLPDKLVGYRSAEPLMGAVGKAKRSCSPGILAWEFPRETLQTQARMPGLQICRDTRIVETPRWGVSVRRWVSSHRGRRCSAASLRLSVRGRLSATSLQAKMANTRVGQPWHSPPGLRTRALGQETFAKVSLFPSCLPPCGAYG
jgi:hypothetical protein